MLNLLRNLLLSALILSTRRLFVSAVYNDEAFTIDWQKENVGPYEWIVEASNDTLMIVSSFDDKSMLSWLNKSGGEVLFRLPVDFRVVDLKISEDNKTILKSEGDDLFAFDAEFGFNFGNISSQFTLYPQQDLSGFSIKNSFIEVLGMDLGAPKILNDLPEGTGSVKYAKTNGTDLTEVLVETSDFQYHFYELTNSSLSKKWNRDESITDIQAYTYVSVTDDSTSKILSELINEESLNIWQAYSFRIQHNFRRLKEALINRRFSVGSFVKDLVEEDDEKTIRQREIRFGLLKYLIVASGEGKIAAMNIVTGEEIWAFETGFGDILSLDTINDNTELVIFTKSGPSLTLDISNVLAKPVVKRTQVVIPSTDVRRLGESDDFYVKTEEGFRVILQGQDKVHSNETYILDHDKHGISAFVVENEHLKESWKLDLKPTEEIVAFSAREHDPTVNLGTILGNRTVLYKYLYPNLASYAVADTLSNDLSVHVIDTVTGELLYTSYHQDKVNLNLPINMIFGEYWFIYTYFSSDPIPEQKIAVVELYESLTPNTRVSNSSVIGDPLTNTLKPDVIANAYFYPEVIKNMILSKTKFGITSKALIMELENGQMTYLPKYVLSARRRDESKMSADDKKEFMAAPYVSGIPINDHSILTHYREILSGSKSKLVSIPTNLESTSIICNLGHDLFCTRISPSSQFDKLSPSFEKGKLICTILGLLFLCFFIRPLVDTKKLKTQWLVKG